ncbi:MAG: LemA family protein [Candidatus Nomurabacteria bacterium]|nr:LemA family protein [Candidatus Nomurabacteria bacterium]
MTILWIILGILGVILLWGVASYNGFITLKNRTNEAWADIDVQLKRRYDLIPNLINTVKGYAAHESSVFQAVTQARTAAISAEQSGDPEKIAKSENMLTGALKSVFAVAEAYPELKANENFQELQRELSDTENKIQAARRFYNANVRDFNTRAESFPSNIIAKMFKFIAREFFELNDAPEERENVKVDF